MACEAFRVSPEISELITQGIGDREVRLAARSQGMRSLREDALRLALAGTTTLDEVLRVTPEDPDFETEELLERLPTRATD
jgi:general secretion pathway protein E